MRTKIGLSMPHVECKPIISRTVSKISPSLQWSCLRKREKLHIGDGIGRR